MRTWFCMILLGAGAAACVGQGDLELRGLGPTAGVQARMSHEDGAAIDFSKAAPGRRMVALDFAVGKLPEPVKALEAECRLKVSEGLACRWALVVVEGDGEDWVKIAGAPETGESARTVRISVSAPRRMEYATAGDGVLDWAGVERVWFGLVVDGVGDGRLEVKGARLTSETARPDKPVQIGLAAENWTQHKDPAAEGKLGVGEGGALRIDFRFPGGRHMFCTNSRALPAEELEGYGALGLDYSAALPPGISGLLVLIATADGTCYRADPMPGPGQAIVARLPLNEFTRAEWTSRGPERLNMAEAVTIWVGVHGAATGDGGPGFIEVRRLALEP